MLKQCCAALCLALTSLLGNAGGMGSAETLGHARIDTSGFQVNGFLGAVALNNYAPSPLIFSKETDSLEPNSSQPWDFTWGVGGAYRWVINNALQRWLHDFTLGLDVFYFQTKRQGDVWQYELPASNNYAYKLPITSVRLMADTEWTFYSLSPTVYPFAEVGIGFANNTMKYNDTPLLPDYGVGTTITSHSQYQFAYTVGGGLKWLLPRIKNTELSFRYLYADLGQAKTTSIANGPLTGPVTLSLRSQTLVAGLTYLF